MPEFNVLFNDPGATYSAYYAEITAAIGAAGATWSALLGATAGAIDVQVAFDPNLATADGGSTCFVPVQTLGGLTICEPGATYELTTGIDPNDGTADVNINIGTQFLTNSLWFDPDPSSRTAPVGPLKIDAESVFLHELGHALGFIGWRNGGTGQLPSTYASTFDRYVTMSGGILYFTGPQAEAVYGGPVPLTYGDYGHVGNAAPRPGSELSQDLMNGFAANIGGRYFISALDVAIVRDAEAAAAPLDTTPIGAGADFLGSGGSDAFMRAGTGQILAQERAANGSATGLIGLSYRGTPWTVDPASAVIGTGQNFLGAGAHDLFLRTGTGQLLAAEFTGAGAAINAQYLTYGGAAWTVDPATSAVGTGQGLWDADAHDVFLRLGNGQLMAAEFNSAGSAINAEFMSFAGSPWTVDPASTVIGNGHSLWGANAHDVFLRLGTGQLLAAEFDSTGKAIDAEYMTFGGNPWTTDGSTTVLGSGCDPAGAGIQDVFFRAGTGQLMLGQFSATGAALNVVYVTAADGSAATVSASATISVAGQNLLGHAGNDLAMTTPGSQTHIWEVSTSGLLVASA